MCQNISTGKGKYTKYILFFFMDKTFYEDILCCMWGHDNSFIMIYNISDKHTQCFLMRCVYETVKI